MPFHLYTVVEPALELSAIMKKDSPSMRNVIGLANLQDVDVLDLDELVGKDATLVDVRTAKELGNDDEELVVNDQRLADHCGCA